MFLNKKNVKIKYFLEFTFIILKIIENYNYYNRKAKKLNLIKNLNLILLKWKCEKNWNILVYLIKNYLIVMANDIK